MMTKKIALNSQCTPTNWRQLEQSTFDTIKPDTEIDSEEQFGHFLFNALAPRFLIGSADVFRKPLYSTVTDFARFRGWSTSVPRRTATWYASNCSGTV